MPQNRLNLNFDLTTQAERCDYVESYINAIPFTLTSDEIETLSDYILWGKDANGLNGHQAGIQLDSKHHTWDTKPVESLDSLKENPAFSEIQLHRLDEPAPRIPRVKFSRAQARKLASKPLLETLESLWTSIDRTEYIIAQYELNHQKRTKPIREPLLRRIDTTARHELDQFALSLKSYDYLKLRHRLVELRRTQFTYKDFYAEPLQLQETFNWSDSLPFVYGEDIDVRPIGIPDSTALMQKIWREDRLPIPSDFNESELRQITKLLWTPAPSNPDPSTHYFDFGDPDHLYRLFQMWDELEDAAARNESLYSTTSFFLRAINIYIKLAKLDPMLEDILQLKKAHELNQNIVEFVNQKYSKNYRPNYISTLYCQKCLGLISAAAKKHREAVENLFFPENWKTCKDCGATLLMNSDNFVKRSRSKDGFSPRCKQCEKIKREKYRS